MAITLKCKLLHGSQVLDESTTCTFSWIQRNPPITGAIEGEGTITILTMFPLSSRGTKPHQFMLLFKSAFVSGVGELEEIPIILIPDDLIGQVTANFKIGKV